jgi:hypothetical protein
MAKLTTSWIKHNLIPVYIGYAKMKSELESDLKKELLKPYLDQLPQAPKGYRASHALGGNFSSFMPLGDVYDENGRTGNWESMNYTKEQQKIINDLRRDLDAKIDAWTIEFANNNQVLQRVLKEQPRLQRKNIRSYKRVSNINYFNEYINECQGDSDDEDIIAMTEVENIVHDYFLTKIIKNVLWDDLVDYIDYMSKNYAEMEEEYVE